MPYESFLRKPDFVRARPSTLLTDDRTYNQVYYKYKEGDFYKLNP